MRPCPCPGYGSAGCLGGQDRAQTWECRGGFRVWTVGIDSVSVGLWVKQGFVCPRNASYSGVFLGWFLASNGLVFEQSFGTWQVQCWGGCVLRLSGGRWALQSTPNNRRGLCHGYGPVSYIDSKGAAPLWSRYVQDTWDLASEGLLCGTPHLPSVAGLSARPPASHMPAPATTSPVRLPMSPVDEAACLSERLSPPPRWGVRSDRSQATSSPSR